MKLDLRIICCLLEYHGLGLHSTGIKWLGVDALRTGGGLQINLGSLAESTAKPLAELTYHL